jgi:hypothetical protein
MNGRDHTWPRKNVHHGRESLTRAPVCSKRQTCVMLQIALLTKATPEPLLTADLVQQLVVMLNDVSL